ncbi:MAG: DNA cytosine methyltransferase [Planctomycetota bacterium]
MNFISLFAGIGGFDLGFERAGMECVAQVEIDERCREVLAHHWPGVDRTIANVKHFGRAVFNGPVDLICGGFPCQDVSVAGRREGLDGERSGLWFEFLRVVEELKPRWVVVENVPGLLSSNGKRDFATVLSGLAECGYMGAYRVFDAQYFRVPQRRRRVFIVGCLGDWQGAAEVLLERESSPWDPAPSREAGARVAAPLTRGSATGRGVNEPGRRREDDVNLVTYRIHAAESGAKKNHAVKTDYARCIDSTGAFGSAQGGTIVFEPRYARNGRGAPDNIVPPLKAQSGQTGKGDGAPLVAFDWQAGGGGSDHSFRGKSRSYIVRKGSYAQLRKNATDAIAGPAYGIRRLMPIECERLQGFPDGFTAVNGMADSPRYRMLGNAVAVPVAEWIGRRIIDRSQRGGSVTVSDGA